MMGTINLNLLYNKLTKDVEFVESTNIGLTQLRASRADVTARWERVGLLDGLQGNVRDNIAQLFESQLSYMVDGNQENNGGGFETVQFPIVNRVFGSLLGSEIQPFSVGNSPIQIDKELYEKVIDEYLNE